MDEELITLAIERFENDIDKFVNASDLIGMRLNTEEELMDTFITWLEVCEESSYEYAKVVIEMRNRT